MPAVLYPAARRLTAMAAAVALLCLAGFGPAGALADTDLTVGGTARVAFANGDNVRLRAAPGYDAGVITLVPEGSTVDVLDGPVAADGSQWYHVGVNGDTGYMVADFLASDGGVAAAAGDGAATATTALNLRAGPSTADDVILVIPAGASVTLTGESANGFVAVTYGGHAGWAFAAYLDRGGTSGNAGAGETATVTSALNLRAGPSTGDAILLLMPAGSAVALTGDAANGFLAVSYQGTAGWAFAAYLDRGGAASGSTTTTSALNLRAGPSTGDAVLTVMPAGATVATTGDPQNGFYPVVYAGQAGWAAGTYLDLGGSSGPSGQPAGNPSSGGSLIVWPFQSGGAWQISQGYNGPFGHQNESATWQYYYSFDLVRVDGDTAGQPVYSPVSGTIRWIDESYGGMAIDLGDGYAVAYFHTAIAAGLAAGQRVEQGQYMGTVAQPGDGGNGGFPHFHISLWQTDDGGNWDRHAVPFTGAHGISGMEFPDVGGESQYAGTVIHP